MILHQRSNKNKKRKVQKLRGQQSPFFYTFESINNINMKPFKQLLFAVAIVFTFAKCNSPKLPVLPVGFEYTIYEDKFDKATSKQTVRVKINHEIEAPVIKDLSQWIRDNRSDADNVLIFYYRTDQEFSGAWASVEYNPEYKLDLIAIPLEKEG